MILCCEEKYFIYLAEESDICLWTAYLGDILGVR